MRRYGRTLRQTHCTGTRALMMTDEIDMPLCRETDMHRISCMSTLHPQCNNDFHGLKHLKIEHLLIFKASGCAAPLAPH